jgi:hypothetical protein
MTTESTSGRQFDLTPHPRILPMLGEINLEQWRCVAELVDNSIDGFLEASRSGSALNSPEVVINTPSSDTSPSAQVSIRDNGPGMNADTLENAVRAGWTSHDPINNLGLFGMGFNIATARLGSRTTIWTTMAGETEWVGMLIDFDALANRRAFVTPAQFRPKVDPLISGTEIVISGLKPEQREWFAKGYNRSNLRKKLGQVYSAMLVDGGQPIAFQMEVDGIRVKPRLHCIWGEPGTTPRSVQTAQHGNVDAFQAINVSLGQRPFCNRCWNWMAVGQSECPQCERDGKVVNRERKITGWIGIQRYLDTQDFGIDILRNGRKIETGNKELFQWTDPTTGAVEKEYPIDDPRGRGRIVGEVHLDHCRVPYTKDRFVREDVAWSEMVQVVRGNSPLQPQKAASLGMGGNTSPLYRLFQVFRRSSPHNRNVGGWTKILAIPDNDRAVEMAKRFDAGEADYLTDDKWWELAEAADTAVLTGMGGPAPGSGIIAPAPTGVSSASPAPSAGGGSNPMGPSIPPGGAPSAIVAGAAAASSRTVIADLSNTFVEDESGLRFEVKAYGVSSGDPDLGSIGGPWRLTKSTSGHWEFFLVISHPIFDSATLTPLDALVAQLAHQVSDYTRSNQSPISFGKALANLRQRYCGISKLDPQSLSAEANAALLIIARSVVGRVDGADLQQFFADLSPGMQTRIRTVMAQRNASDPSGAVADGRLLEYSPPEAIVHYVIENPSVFFDGEFWEEPFVAIDYGDSAANETARRQLLAYYRSMLEDAVWLATQTPDDLGSVSRDRLLRASLSTSLIGPANSLP